MSPDLLVETFRTRAVVCLAAFLTLLSFPHGIRAQRTDKPAPKTVQKTKKPAEDRTHWKFLLDSLIVETRLVDPEQERPVVMADLANAYWLIDQQQARKLFTEAFDAAVALTTDPPVVPVIARIAKRDRPLATELMKRLLAALALATEVQDKATRIRAQLAIVKAVIK